MGCSVIFQYRATMGIDQIWLISIFLTSNVYHLLVLGIFKVLFSSYLKYTINY
jgi:hypothetical protein